MGYLLNVYLLMLTVKFETYNGFFILQRSNLQDRSVTRKCTSFIVINNIIKDNPHIFLFIFICLIHLVSNFTTIFKYQMKYSQHKRESCHKKYELKPYFHHIPVLLHMPLKKNKSLYKALH
jgi:hypothetical protein